MGRRVRQLLLAWLLLLQGVCVCVLLRTFVLRRLPRAVPSASACAPATCAIRRRLRRGRLGGEAGAARNCGPLVAGLHGRA